MRRLLFVALLTLSAPLWAAQTLEPGVLRALGEAQQAQQRGDLQAARRALDGVKAAPGSLEQALLWRSRGYLAWAEGNRRGAIEALEQALASGKLEPAQAGQERDNLARLNYAEGRHAKVVELLAARAAGLDDDGLQMLIQSYQALKQPAKALPLAERYLARQPQAGDVWLQFMVAANAQLKRDAEAERWQRRLLARHPDDLQAWQQLAALQQRAGAPDKALATLRTAQRRGLRFAAAELDNLTLLAGAAGQPWQGARLLAGLLDSGLLSRTAEREERLALFWWQARERAQAAAAYRQLAERSGAGRHWLRVAQLELERERWQAALEALNHAERGGADRRQVRQWRGWARQQLEGAALLSSR